MDEQPENLIPPEEKKKMGVKEFFSIGEVFGYFFRKKNKDEVPNVNTKIMHGINRLAIIIFLLGVIYMILKHFL